MQCAKLIWLVKFSYPPLWVRPEIVNNGLNADRKLCRPLNHSHANFNMGPFLLDLRFLSSTLSIIKRGLTDLLSPSKYFKHSNQQRESTSRVRPRLCAKKFHLGMKLDWQSLNHEKQIFESRTKLCCHSNLVFKLPKPNLHSEVHCKAMINFAQIQQKTLCWLFKVCVNQQF